VTLTAPEPDALAHCDGSTVMVGVPKLEGVSDEPVENDPDVDALTVTLIVSVAPADVDALLETDSVSELFAENVADEDTDSVPDGDAETETLPVAVRVARGDALVDTVTESLADVVGETDSEAVSDDVRVARGDTVSVTDTVPVWDFFGLAEDVDEELSDRETRGDTEPVADTVDDALARTERDSEGLEVTDGEGSGLLEEVGHTETDRDT
jgi:hypothetical protein